jgi:hypothetical protein
LHRNCFIEHIVPGKIEGREKEERLRQLRNDLQRKEEEEMALCGKRGSTRWHCVENSFWRKIWICRKTHKYGSPIHLIFQKFLLLWYLAKTTDQEGP